MKHFTSNKFYGWLLVVLLALGGPLQPLVAAPLQHAQSTKNAADALMAQGMTLFQQQRWQEALKKFEAACPLYQQAGVQPEEARCWQAVGQTRLNLGDQAGALEAYHISLVIWQILGEPFQEVITLSQIGGILHATHQYDAAEQVYAQLSPLLDKVLTDLNHPLQDAEKAGLGNISNDIALFYSSIGQYESAYALYLKTLEIHVDVGNYGGSAATLNNIGLIYSKWGRYSDALINYEVALNLAQQLYQKKLDTGESLLSILGNMGVAYTGQGNFQQALKLYQQSLDLAQQIGDDEGEEANLLNLGLALNALGEQEQAEIAFNRAYTIAQTIQDWQGEAAALNNMADIQLKGENYEEALKLYQQALTVARNAHNPHGEGIAQNNIGQTFTLMQQYELALQSLGQALAIAQVLGERESEAIALNNLGQVHYERQAYRQALGHFQQALKLAQQYDLRLHERVALNNIAKVQNERGQPQAAIASLQQAIAAFESIQSQLTVQAFIGGYAAQQMTAYQRMVAWLWEADKFAEAFDYAERARAQAFLQRMRNQGIDVYTEAASPLIQQERVSRRHILGLQNELKIEEEKPVRNEDLLTELNDNLDQARAEYSDLLTRLELENPEHAALVSAPVLSLDQLSSEVLDEQTTLIEYFVTDAQTFVWVVDRQGTYVIRLDVTADELQAWIDELHAEKEDVQTSTVAAGALYEALFAPLAPYVVQTNLVIAPHGVLHYLPFAALWNQQTGRYLIEEYTLTFVPSASVLPYIQAKHNPNQGRLLALGNPDFTLPEAENEVQAIARLYNAQPLLNEAASEGKVYAFAGQIDILHLSAHGVLNPINPLFGAIELAADDEQDGHLEVHEVYGLDLSHVNVVVLSACETALGEQSDGDELVGLTRAFLYAGAPSVITTLWSVQSDTTETLMVAFYTHLRAGATPAVALQEAQVEMIQAGEYSPDHWAAFTLSGDSQGGSGQ